MEAILGSFDFTLSTAAIQKKLPEMTLNDHDRDAIRDTPDRNNTRDSQKIVKRGRGSYDDLNNIFLLFLLFGRVVRNTPDMASETKEAALEFFIYAGLAFWSIFAKDIGQQLEQENLPEWLIRDRNPAEIKQFLRKLVGTTLPIVLQNLMADVVGNPKLDITLLKLWSKKLNVNNEPLKFFIAFLISDLQIKGYLDIDQEFLDGVNSKELLNLALFKLSVYHIMSIAPKKGWPKIRELIVHGKMRLVKGPKSHKTLFYADLNKRFLLQRIKQY